MAIKMGIVKIDERLKNARVFEHEDGSIAIGFKRHNGDYDTFSSLDGSWAFNADEPTVPLLDFIKPREDTRDGVYIVDLFPGGSGVCFLFSGRWYSAGGAIIDDFVNGVAIERIADVPNMVIEKIEEGNND